MLIAVEVIGRSLQLRGATHPIGERIMLDPADPQHQEVLDKGWARRLDASVALPQRTAAKTIDAPPTNKMVSAATSKTAQSGATRKPQQKG